MKFNKGDIVYFINDKRKWKWEIVLELQNEEYFIKRKNTYQTVKDNEISKQEMTNVIKG